MIRFTCPNGHKLSINESAAGKPGKCPNCKAKFFVPKPDENEPSPSEDDMIVFLCPNGHRLNGPKELQGKAGQCPHCNSKFHIPIYDDELVDDDDVIEDVEEFEEVSEVASVGSSIDEDENPFAAMAAADSSPDVSSSIPAAPSAAPASDEPQSQQAIEPSSGVSQARQTAAVFLRFWRGRREPEQVEIGFSGQSLVVHFFDISSVEADIGRFAIRQDDGKHAIYLVAWSDITHVAKLASKRLPGDFTS